jgi:hypothetical protein
MPATTFLTICRVKFTALIALVAALSTANAAPANGTEVTPPVANLGINCRGSSNCGLTTVDGIANRLVEYIQQIPDDAWYDNGQHIACYDFICAFLQGTGGTWGSILKQLAPYIPDHGCTACGSVPYYFPQGDNNVADGQLTFNYVDNDCGYGLC